MLNAEVGCWNVEGRTMNHFGKQKSIKLKIIYCIWQNRKKSCHTMVENQSMTDNSVSKLLLYHSFLSFMRPLKWDSEIILLEASPSKIISVKLLIVGTENTCQI